MLSLRVLTDFDKDSLKVVNFVCSMFCLGAFAVFATYFVLKTPLVFLAGILYAPVMTLVYERKKKKLKRKYFGQLGLNFYKVNLKSEHYVNLLVMSWFFLMIGLFLGKILP